MGYIFVSIIIIAIEMFNIYNKLKNTRPSPKYLNNIDKEDDLVKYWIKRSVILNIIRCIILILTIFIDANSFFVLYAALMVLYILVWLIEIKYNKDKFE